MKKRGRVFTSLVQISLNLLWTNSMLVLKFLQIRYNPPPFFILVIKAFFWGGGGLGEIFLGRMVVPSPKMVKNLPRTYEKLPIKEETFQFSGNKTSSYRQTSCYFIIRIYIKITFRATLYISTRSSIIFSQFGSRAKFFSFVTATRHANLESKHWWPPNLYFM